MGRRKILLAAFLLLFLDPAFPLNATVNETCNQGQELISINDTAGGHLAVPGHYGNRVCVEDASGFTIRDSCKNNETFMFSMANKTNSHFSEFPELKHDVCSDITRATVRSGSCLSNETDAFSVFDNTNAHAGDEDHFSNKVCLSQQPAENITLKLSGLSGSFFADDSSISTGESITLAEYPYIVAENSGFVRGIVSYETFLRMERSSSDTMTLTQDGKADTFLLPFTRGSHPEIEDEEDSVLNKNFLGLVSPSFAFAIPKEPTVRVIRQADHSVNGFSSLLSGNLEFQVESRGLENGNVTVAIRPQN